jgi:hypothetical protein
VLTKKYFENIYYWIFPEEYKKKLALESQKREQEERQEKADLLLQYEELQADAEKRIKELRWDSDLLYEFYRKIGQVIETKSFERRFKGESAKSIIESFDVNRLGKYDEIKRRAIDCENTLIRIFVVKQKLKLLGIDRGVKENDRQIY